ncbi:response regulator transcription factor [Marinicrinis sediminis]|uniref:Response regulator transcription factor n=1 Tax=Marinicrinis sediminis TaxID=1652465 RepID=A0ABW5RC51_9BACL
MQQILIVEDDTTIAMGIEYALQQEGFAVQVCHRAQQALEQMNQNRYDLIILDVGLPDGNGFDLCKQIRSRLDTPVIFLTAIDDEVNVVMGLDIGADDYVTKPFRVRELISRMKSVLRRSGKQTDKKTEIQLGDVSVHPSEAKVTKSGQEVALTPIEYKLLLTFANHKGQTLSRHQILEGIWDVAGDFVNDNTLTVYIKRLREKIEHDPQHPVLIQTVRGLGYRAGETP